MPYHVTGARIVAVKIVALADKKIVFYQFLYYSPYRVGITMAGYDEHIRIMDFCPVYEFCSWQRAVGICRMGMQIYHDFIVA